MMGGFGSKHVNSQWLKLEGQPWPGPDLEGLIQGLEGLEGLVTKSNLKLQSKYFTILMLIAFNEHVF